MKLLQVFLFGGFFSVATVAFAQDGLKPRIPGLQKTLEEMTAAPHEPVVIIKFQDGFKVRLDGKRQLTGLKPQQTDAIMKLLVDADNAKLSSLFSMPAKELDARRERAQARSKSVLTDLNLYYRVRLAAPDGAPKLAAALGQLDFVEFAEPMPSSPPPPQHKTVDIDPPTPDLSGAQGYRGAAPAGLNPPNPQAYPGADGRDMRVVDVEYGWILNHEDLFIPEKNMLLPPNTGWANIGYAEHGTKALGIMVARDNGYGLTGLAAKAEAFVSPQVFKYIGNTYPEPRNTPDALMRAGAAIREGDVILMETQAYVCGTEEEGPSEWRQEIFDTVEILTAEGYIVIAAAGNGAINLDDPDCQGLFDGSERGDSGAIIVGASVAGQLVRASFSSFGSRVDVQGWGNDVATTGNSFNVGDLWQAGSDDRQRYTGLFGGTSSASPIVAGAALAIQSRRKYCGLPVLDSREMRDLLVATGTPQRFPSGGPIASIGPQPNIEAALKKTHAYDFCVNVEPTKGFAVSATRNAPFTAASRTYTIVNRQPRGVRFKARARHPKFSVTPRNGTISPYDSVTITVTTPAIATVTDPVGTYGGALIIQPRFGNQPKHRIPLTFAVTP